MAEANGTETFTATLTDTHGLLSATGATSGNDTAALTIAGVSLTALNADLTTLTDTDGTAGTDNITVTVTDHFGNTTTETIDVTVAAAPTISAVAAQTIGINQLHAISVGTVAEANGTETFTATLTDTHGVLAASGGSWDSSDHTLTISGSLSALNTDLATLTDTNGTAGTDNITMTATDSFGNRATQTIDVTVNGLQNLVVNGAFETGNLDGWTTVTTPGPDQPQYDFVTNTPGDVLSGSTYALSIGPVNAEWSVYQNISTVPGDTYQVQFWLSNPAGGTPSNFTASFGAATLVSLSNSAAQNYTEYTYDVTATGTSTELLFVGEQNPAYWYLDDVSVVDVSRVGLKGTESVTIESGATLELGASDSQIITFATDTGTLKLDSPSTFTGQILGFTGTAPNLAHSDAIDLVGFDAADTTVSASTAGGITTLTVTDSSGDGLSATLKLVGTYSTSDFVVASDGDGGTDIFDPPVTGQTSGTSAPPVAGATSGTSATLGFALGNDQINLDPGQIETKSYDGPLGGQGPGGKPTVSLGGPGNDNFIFHPALGADTGSFNPPAHTTEYGHFTSPEDQHWSSLIKQDAMEFVHSDGIMPPDLDATHWHLHLQNAVHLQ